MRALCLQPFHLLSHRVPNEQINTLLREKKNANGVSGKVITVSWPTRKRYTGDSYTPDALKTNTSPQGHEEMERRFLAEWLVPRADLARSVAARKTVQSVPPGVPGTFPACAPSQHGRQFNRGIGPRFRYCTRSGRADALLPGCRRVRSLILIGKMS